MKKVLSLAFAVLFSCVWSGALIAAPIADSQADFSSVQGQGNWFYGVYEQAIAGPHNYMPADFVQFDIFNGSNDRWEASDALVGANNNDFLNLDADGGHPTGLGPGSQDSIIWAVRRYVSPVAGLLHISFDLRKINVSNPGGGGITGRIFVDGYELFTQFIANDDGTGVKGGLTHLVGVGSIIDFAIDPLGTAPIAGADGIYSARADGSHFSATLREQVPESSILALMSLGLAGIGFARKKQ